MNNLVYHYLYRYNIFFYFIPTATSDGMSDQSYLSHNLAKAASYKIFRNVARTE